MLVSNQVVVTGLQARSPHHRFAFIPTCAHGATNRECNLIRVNKSHVYPFNFLLCSQSKRSRCFSSVQAHGNDVQIGLDTFTSSFVILRRKTAGREKVCEKRDIIRQHSE